MPIPVSGRKANLFGSNEGKWRFLAWDFKLLSLINLLIIVNNQLCSHWGSHLVEITSKLVNDGFLVMLECPRIKNKQNQSAHFFGIPSWDGKLITSGSGSFRGKARRGTLASSLE